MDGIPRWRQGCAIAFGVLTHALFAATVWYLFWFLAGYPPVARTGPLWIDLLLVLQFAVVHSLLMLPATRRRLASWIRPELYGCFYCTATCLGLLLTFFLWRTSGVIVWQWHGPLRTLIQVAFLASWVALFYSLSLTGLGYQTGLTPWWHWVRGQPMPRREFRPRGAYRWIRHPVYLSFLGLLWLTPLVRLDRALLIAIWSLYIFVGSYLKDRRLVYYIGAPYRAYQSRVPGYPLVPFGPLARRGPAPAVGEAPGDTHRSKPRKAA